MLGQNGLGGGADGPGCQHELLLLEPQHLTAHHPGHIHPVDRAQGDDDAVEPGAQDHHDENDIEGEGDGADDVHNAHHHRVGRPAQIAGEAAVEDPDDQIHQHGHEGHGQRNPGAVHQPGQDVPPQGVGAQKVGAVPHMAGGVDIAALLVAHHIGAAAVVEGQLGAVAVEDGHGFAALLPEEGEGLSQSVVAVDPQQLERLGDVDPLAVGDLVDLHQRRDVDPPQVLVGVGVGGEQGTQQGEEEQKQDHDKPGDGGGLVAEAEPDITGKSAVFAPDLLPVFAGLFQRRPFVFHGWGPLHSYLIRGSMRQ